MKEAAGEQALILIQDCSLALVPRILKLRNPNLVVAQSWQIPWPHREIFRIFPWKRELLRGMLASDLLALRQPSDCRNFLDSVDCAIEAKVDPEQSEITHCSKITLVRPFPMSIDFEAHSTAAACAEVENEMTQWRRQLGARTDLLGIGIDSLDYIIGSVERFRALELLLLRRPEYRQRLTFMQLAPTGRGCASDGRLTEIVHQINARWGNAQWRPVVLLRSDGSRAQMIALHRMADFCLASSPHQGVGQAGEEFVASRCDSDGVLILSQFAAANAELQGAILVNPLAENEIAEALHCALTLPVEQRRRRMRQLREALAEHDAHRWAAKMISTMLKLARRQAAPAPAPTAELDLPPARMAAGFH